MQTAASDWAAARLAVAIERVAEALLVEEEAVPQMMQQNIKWDGPEDTRQMRGTARLQLAKMSLDEATGSFVYKRKRAKPLI
jgi:hypothetical protein